MIGKPDLEGYCHPISKEKAFELSSISIEECDFSVRSFNVLKRAEVKNLLELALLSEEDLSKLKNCGKGSIKEMKECLKEHEVLEIPVCVFDTEQEELDAKIHPNPDDGVQSIADALELLKTINIEDANLSVRATNCLTRYGLKTLYDFAILSMDDAMKIPNLGRRSIKEIATFLRSYGIIYPLENINLDDIHPSLKYTGLSDETAMLLENSEIKLLDDLVKFSDDELYELLSICPELDSLKILYHLSVVKNIVLKKDYFRPYLKYAVEEIAKGLKKSNGQILSLAFGLFGEKIWPLNVLASSLALPEQQMIALINKLLSVYLVTSNYQRIKPLIDYIDNNSDTVHEDGYVSLIKTACGLNNKQE